MVKKIFGIVVLVVLTTYIINLRSENQKLITNLVDLAGEIVSLKKDLSKIVDNDIEQFINLPEGQQKVDKANEILGKMMLVFLANLELEISKKQVKFAKSAIAKREEPIAPEKEPNEPREEFKPEEIETVESVASAETGTIGDFKAKDFEEEKAFLDKVARKDLYLDLRKTKSLFEGIEKSYPFLLGTFQGNILILKNNKKWPLHVDVEMNPDGKNHHYNIEIQFPNGGRSQGRGNRKDIYHKIQGDSSNGIILKFSDERYFQLFYNRASNSLTGNYYELRSGIFERRGIVKLDKH